MTQLTEFLKVLADPTRMKIIKFIMKRDLYVCELGKILDISQPTVSQHLRRLKSMELVLEKREGQRIYYQFQWEVFGKLRRELDNFFDLPAEKLTITQKQWQQYLDNLCQLEEIVACKEGAEKAGG